MTDYIVAISYGYPNIQVSCYGDTTVYSNIVWSDTTQIISQELLDQAYLESCIASTVSNINNLLNTYVNNGFTWTDGHIYDSDTAGRANMTGAILGVIATGANQIAPNTPFTEWHTKDNALVPLTPAQLLSIGPAMLAWYSGMVIYAATLEKQVLSMTDINTLNAFDPTAGWPSHN